MFDPALINSLSEALTKYRNAIDRTETVEKKEDFSRLAAITEAVVTSMQSEDIAEIKVRILGFSRQVSDSYSIQPPEFKELAKQITKIKSFVI